MRSSVRWLNVGTSLRILAVPAVMALLLLPAADDDGFRLAAAILFALAAATDFLDGYLARRWQATSVLGSFLDTTADKLLVTGTLIALLSVERASPWVVAIIVGRELVILGLRGMVAVDGTVLQASGLGKAKTAIQFLAILLAILRAGDPLGPLHLDEWVMLVAAAVTVASAVDYLTRFAHALRS